MFLSEKKISDLKIYLMFNREKVKEKRNKCFINKRNRSFIRFFGINRNSLKMLFNREDLPGLIKSSW